MKFARAVLGMILLLAATTAPGLGQVIEGPDGPVEFVGLQEWTARELFDAIQELAPGQPFHACAAVMQRDLGFAEAAAMSYRTMGSADVYTVVVGVEDATRVRPRTIGSDALVLAATDPADRVAGMAGLVLRGLTAPDDSLRPVDWTPAEEPLLAIFGGTSPFQFGTTLRALVATGITPEFGRQLARQQPDLLLAYAGAEHRGTRAPAIAFLQAISGEDFGTDVEAWAAWIHGQPD